MYDFSVGDIVIINDNGTLKLAKLLKKRLKRKLGYDVKLESGIIYRDVKIDSYKMIRFIDTELTERFEGKLPFNE